MYDKKGLDQPPFYFALCLRCLFIKFRVESIKIATVQFFLYNAQTFAETLVVDNFALTQEADRLTDFRVFYKTENVVVGSACFLLCCNCERTTYHVEQIGQAAFTHTKTEY